MELIGNPFGVAKRPGLFFNGVKDEVFVMGSGWFSWRDDGARGRATADVEERVRERKEEPYLES